MSNVLCIEQSRRDDLESLGYMLVYFMNGTLPWLKYSNGKLDLDNCEKIKKNITLKSLCHSLPGLWTKIKYTTMKRTELTIVFSFWRFSRRVSRILCLRQELSVHWRTRLRKAENIVQFPLRTQPISVRQTVRLVGRARKLKIIQKYLCKKCCFSSYQKKFQYIP